MAAGDGRWTLPEQIVLVEAVQRYATGILPDFNMVCKVVKLAMGYIGNSNPREADFYTPKRCEGKWQEMLLADDARRSAIGQKRRAGGENPTSVERAGEMISTLRESRKAEIRNLLTIVAGDNAQADKDIASAAAADHATLERFVAEASKHPDLALISSLKAEASANMPHHHQQQPAQQAPAQQHQDAHRPAAAQPADQSSAGSASSAAAAAPASDRRHSVSTKAAHDATPVQHASKQKGAAGASVPASRTAAPAAAAPAEDEEVVEELPPAVLKKRSEGMTRVWKAINAHEKAEPFKKPVTKREAPDYHTVIKRPMALNDVKKKVDKNEYKGDHKEFLEDMHLIMLNAMTYNQKGSEIWTWAKELQAILKKEEQVFEEAGMGTAEAPAVSRVRGGKASAGTPADEEDDTASVASSKAGGSRGRPKKEEEEEEEEAPSRANRSRRQSAGAPRDRKRRRDD